MGLLQKTYIQKSRIFLLPLLGIKKDRVYKETNTYISANNLISKEYRRGISLQDETLIVTYTKDYEKRELENASKLKTNTPYKTWEKFETEVLMSNKYFTNFYETDDEYVYIFNMSNWSIDWTHFINGSYSALSSDAKKLILRFRWEFLAEQERTKLYCYLYPYKDECKSSFATELGMKVTDLTDIKELCDKPNLKLENYVYKNVKLESQVLNDSKD